MGKKLSLLLLTLLLCSTGLYSQPRSENEAQAIAKDFLSSSSTSRREASNTVQLKLVSTETISREVLQRPFSTRSASSMDVGFYIFNDEANLRYVIVSGDKRQYDILGYSEDGLFPVEDIPCCMAYMLGEFCREYDYLSGLGSFPTFNETESYQPASDQERTPRRAAYTSCILQTKWGQGKPYNNKCNGNLAGCVAVAMAQIMYYHKYPSTYSWSNMLTSYSSSYTTTQANAVATLIKDCGEAVHMDYGKDGSSAKSFDAAWALAHKFYYNQNIKYYKKDYFPQSEWENIILNELRNKRPVLYGGHNGETDDKGAGHAFVLDGYDGNGYYHFNWGWHGNGVNPNYSSGEKSYFMLTSLKPKEGNSMHDYTYNQDMVCQISPQTVGKFDCVYYADKFIVNNFTLGSNFKVKFKNLYCYCTNANSFDTSFNGEIGFEFINIATNKGLIWSKPIENKAGYGWSDKEYEFKIKTGGVADGTYYMYPCVISGVSNGTAQNVTFIRTLNTQYDYYLATVTNGKVTLVRKGDIKINNIKLDVENISLPKGRTQLIVEDIEPSNATNKYVTWSTSNSTVAEVDDKGKVTANAEGNAVITCAATDRSGVKATCNVKVVIPKIAFNSVQLNKTQLSQEEFLKAHAVLVNTGESVDCEILTELAILDKEKKIVAKSDRDIDTPYRKNEPVELDFQLSLADIPIGEYYATVLYFDSWDKNKWIYTSTYLYTIVISEIAMPDIYVSEDHYVTFSCTTKDVEIFYVFAPGGDTSASWGGNYEKGSPVKIDCNGIIGAQAYKDGVTSALSTKFVSDYQVSTPTITPLGDNRVEIVCSDAEELYYTLNGNEPSEQNGERYDGKPFECDIECTIKAIGIRKYWNDSKVSSFSYKPTAILNIRNNLSDDGSYYDLTGRRIGNKKQKGLYIVNGRKLFVK